MRRRLLKIYCIRKILSFFISKIKCIGVKITKTLFHYFPILRVWLHWFSKLSKFKQNFSIAFIIGMVSYCCLLTLQQVPIITDTKNAIFDNTLFFFTDIVDKKTLTEKPVLIALDEESMDDTSWKDEASEVLAFRDILQLASYAFNKNSQHVFVDLSTTEKNNLSVLKEFIQKHKYSAKPLHLYVVVPTKRNTCLQTVEREVFVIPTILDKVPLINGNLYIHPVLPNYFEDSDKVVRTWNLFSVYKYHHINKNQSISDSKDAKKTQDIWTFLPSPQLAYHSVKELEENNKANLDNLKQLPWLQSFQYTKHNNIQHTSKSEYANDSFHTLGKLTESDTIKRFCANKTTCIQPAFVKRGNQLKDTKLHDNLLKHIMHKGSVKCNQAIDNFVQKYRSSGLRQDTMNNRIIYLMRSWDDGRSSYDQHYDIFTPLQLKDPNQKIRLEASWQNRLVAIGTEYGVSNDIDYLTPIGNMSGVMINLNAMVSLNQFGPIGLLPAWQKFLLNVVIIFLAAWIFATFRAAMATFIIFSCFVLFILVFYQWMFKNGVWIEFGLPLVVINIAEFFLQSKKPHIEEKQRGAEPEK